MEVTAFNKRDAIAIARRRALHATWGEPHVFVAEEINS